MEKWIENIITMKNIYLVNTKSRAASYGIGTYINQVIMCLSQTASLHLTVVELDSDNLCRRWYGVVDWCCRRKNIGGLIIWTV